MAKRVAPSRNDADNPAGNFMSAAGNDWHCVRRFHVGTDHSQSTGGSADGGPEFQAMAGRPRR
mgnify:CR=1 FL=1